MKKIFMVNNNVTVEVVGATENAVALSFKAGNYPAETVVQIKKENLDELFSFFDKNHCLNGFQAEEIIECKARYKESIIVDGERKVNYYCSNSATMHIYVVCGIATIVVSGDGTIDSVYGRFAIDVATNWSTIKKINSAANAAMGEAAMNQWRRW